MSDLKVFHEKKKLKKAFRMFLLIDKKVTSLITVSELCMKQLPLLPVPFLS